ncbi:permease and ATP-binding protein of yersiniabactin-iron ABC transporter YbtQ [Escherichia coli]|uniref:Permease and ATP-binding protein of yersiniabactin-iron ABC transporter YbtQ n=1 Tax=Escherichia coli TaxID=562 RepID=A0A376WXW4_ECOLX|nr:permease and ATP-binding protein of yersiniabactin-iron ABC transporter YbtQ [Escherichia coli]
MKDNNPADNLAWRVIWRQLISSVGSQARMLRRSMLALLLAAFMQGIAFACLIRSLMRCYGETRRNFLTGLWPSASPQL